MHKVLFHLRQGYYSSSTVKNIRGQNAIFGQFLIKQDMIIMD